MKLLLYCTKAKPYLYQHFKGDFFTSRTYDKSCIYNGKIVAECDFEVEALERIGNNIRFAGVEDGEWLNNRYYEYKSCLSEEELFNYVKNKFYAIHIKNLNIFNKPKELSDYCLYPKNIKGVIHFVLEGTPYILLSVSPQEMFRLFNGEQTVLVRKKVLKEMFLNDK